MADVTTDQVWRLVGKRSFAVVGWATPRGEPRSAGVLYRTSERRVYLGVDDDSWKARHIAASGHVSLTVLVRRGGVLSLVAPLPPATITFRGTAVVHHEDTLDTLPKVVEGVLPPDGRRHGFAIIEVRPAGDFVTYGIGVPMLTMRHPEKAGGRAPVS
jgi:hypothetical protein